MAERSIQIAGAAIDDVALVALTAHADARGSFTEVFQDNWGTVLKPVQFSVVASRAGVMRGCHLHLNHDEYFCLISGEASLGLRDERPHSATRGNWALFRLHAEDPAAVVFPRGLVHGWYFHQDSVHLQAVSEAYSDYAGYDNHRIDWLDPDLEIPWPSRSATTSLEAGAAQSLREVRKLIERGRGA